MSFDYMRSGWSQPWLACHRRSSLLPRECASTRCFQVSARQLALTTGVPAVTTINKDPRSLWPAWLRFCMRFGVPSLRCCMRRAVLHAHGLAALAPILSHCGGARIAGTIDTEVFDSMAREGVTKEQVLPCLLLRIFSMACWKTARACQKEAPACHRRAEQFVVPDRCMQCVHMECVQCAWCP